MVWWIPLAIAAAQAAGGAYAKSQKTGKSKTQRNIRNAGGLDKYDPQAGQAREAIGTQEGPAGFIGKSLEGFNGDREDWQKMLKDLGPALAASQANTGAYRDIQSYGEYDLPEPEEYMQAYGSQAGQLAKQSGANSRATQSAMARRGLGNSAALSALAGQQSQALSGQQSDLYSKLYQGSLSQRMANTQLRSQWAGRAFDVNQNIASMALGSLQAPREPAQKTNMWGSIAQGAGAALGNYFATNNTQGSTQNSGVTAGGESKFDKTGFW